MTDELLFKDECYAIQGAVFDVYKELGAGFLESVYQECLEKELLARQIPYESQRPLRLTYKGQVLEQTYKADLVCYGRVLVEIKAVRSLTGEHRAQVMNYLKGTGLRLGLLVNFGAFPKATVERMIF
ncbi:MAG: GxxExxY protein [Phycisphaerae bacterium]|nr:GxxExxY protein [Phycisphaerae bacterium]